MTKVVDNIEERDHLVAMGWTVTNVLENFGVIKYYLQKIVHSEDEYDDDYERCICQTLDCDDPDCDCDCHWSEYHDDCNCCEEPYEHFDDVDCDCDCHGDSQKPPEESAWVSPDWI